MSDPLVLWLNDEQSTLDVVGGKGASLTRLIQAGLPVPDGFHITTRAYRLFVKENDLDTTIQATLKELDLERPASIERAASRIHSRFLEGRIPDSVANAIVTAYAEIEGSNPAVAVRSSATAEDLPEASFAGQQESFLNVSGADQVLEATKQCWSSLWSARAIGYRSRQSVGDEGVALAVVVQRLVPAEVAGILFTANPVDGNRSQIQLSASWGLGDAIVGGRVTPDNYLVRKDDLQVIKHEIANKDTMTVRIDGATEDQPVPGNLRTVSTLGIEEIRELAELGLQIEELFGMPMDVEWARVDDQISILQARPITGLPEVVVPPPEDWELPNEKGRYMRTSIIDMMPDPLSPLFSSMALPIYNNSIIHMMMDITGSKAEALPDNIIVTIHDYAYMRVNFRLVEWWSMVVKMGPKLPNLIREGPDHFRHVALPSYRDKVDRLTHQSVTELPAQQLWQESHELTRAAMDHLSILQVDTLGAAAGSEGLFTTLYDRFFKDKGDPAASSFLMGYNTIPIQSEKSLYELARWALEQPSLAPYLLETRTSAIASNTLNTSPPEQVDPAIWAQWCRTIKSHLQTFGYILYDLDFAEPVPAEDAAPEIETVKMYMRGEGSNPFERQQRLERQREAATEDLLSQATGLRGWAVRKALGWAQSVGQVREDSIASIGLAYPQLRRNLRELGRRLANSGALSTPSEIFWLEASEISERLEAVHSESKLEPITDVIEKRKKVYQAEQKVMPLSQLPPSDKYMGIPVDVFLPGEGGTEGNRLKGVGASGGKVSGTAYVLHGPEDFDQMKPGGILVAKLTTPAWTPLFAMAGGVVTDIGGPLSHGSIVAREYGIPAVLGTGSATRIIQSGQRIKVDGDSGFVHLSQAD